ncbi:MAG: DNA cytosine methyltransferase [Bacteroides sp.]|nr:DNA cytosine methyltransferase [Bacteroides sp.]
MGNKFRMNSFFAGIGGFDLGCERRGFETSLLCEINPFCHKILSYHWPNIPIKSDITEIHPSEIPMADLWCGGFPCQDISLARASSERLGLKGSRSGLFFTFADLVEQAMPKVILIENVEGLLNSNKGRDFGTIIQRMVQLGYGVAWRLLNSRYFGVPQSRSRMYICCWKNRVDLAVKSLFEDGFVEKPENPRNDFLTLSSPVNVYPQVPKVAYCLAASSGRHTGTDWSRTYVADESGVRRLTPLESERLQGFPDNWTLVEDVQGDIEEIDTLRYTAVGNAVSVPVIEWIAERIYNNLSSKSRGHSREDIINFNHHINKAKPLNMDLLSLDFSNSDLTFKWAKAGFANIDMLYQVEIPPSPKNIAESELFPLIEKTASKKYYLTSNAASGILRRVDKQGRTLFAPLRNALEREAAKLQL